MPKKFLSKVCLDTNFSSKVKLYEICKSFSMINRRIINLSTCNFWRLELLGSVIIAIVKDLNLVVAGKEHTILFFASAYCGRVK
jgi:hypothetical protein